eukprot:2387247-Rhodomonas_salina.1
MCSARCGTQVGYAGPVSAFLSALERWAQGAHAEEVGSLPVTSHAQQTQTQETRLVPAQTGLWGSSAGHGMGETVCRGRIQRRGLRMSIEACLGYVRYGHSTMLLRPAAAPRRACLWSAQCS